ncbi:MAG: transketolase [Methanobacteriota archaeon]|nr:MAG: transketolase [Euryarchaeota archaeon]
MKDSSKVVDLASHRVTTLNAKEIEELKAKAVLVRKWVIRTTCEAGSGHPGGSLSATDILVALYFGGVMRYDPKRPDWEERDRFILSKGHAAPAFYATLALAGFFPEEELLTLRKFGSRLQGHPSMHTVAGVEMSTGALGHGLSVANGIALAARLDKRNYYVFVLLGDGELDAGQVWEAAMAAAHYKLGNLIAIVDRNELQIDGPTEEVMSLEPLAKKFEAFGWHTQEVDGHNFYELISAIEAAKSVKTQPSVIIAHTIKGKGVPFMEGNLAFHGKAPTKEEAEEALRYLEGL